MTRYMRWLEKERGLSFDGYGPLWEWSVTELEDFWASIWAYFGVSSPTPHSDVLAERTMPGARWFPGAELNYAEHLFRGKADDEIAILHASELRELGSADLGRAAPAGRAGGGRTARAAVSSAATVSPRTCRTSPRR